MSANPSTELEADETAQKRPQAEQFSFAIEAPEMVEVTNQSHETPADHQYVVSVDDMTGELMACTCPHHVHCNAFCKHMAGIENITNDGTLEAFPSENNEDDSESTDCDCDSLSGFPRWPCVRAGRREMLNES